MTHITKFKVRLVSCASVLAVASSMAAFVYPAAAQNAQAAPPQSGDNEVVVVTGIRGSLRSAATLKRNSAQVTDSITATDIGKFPDKNLGEALQRVTGVQISRSDGEGRNVTIRGAQPNLVRTEIDGATALPLSFGAGDRATDFRDMPVEFVSHLDVIKSQLPEDTEGGIGGIVRVVNRRPFDSKKPFFAASAQGVYSTTAKTTDPKYAFVASRLFFDDKVGVLVSFNTEDRHLYRYGDLQTGWLNDLDLNGDGIKDFRPQIPRPDVEQRLTKRMAYNVVLEWHPSDNLQFFTEANVARGHEAVDSQLMQLSANQPLAGIDLAHTTFNATKDKSGAATVNHIELISTTAAPMQLQYRNIDGTQTRNQYSLITGGKWKATDKLTVDGRYSYSVGNGHNDERDSQVSIKNLPRATVDYTGSQLVPNMQLFADTAGTTKLDPTTGNLTNQIDATNTPFYDTASEKDSRFNVEYRPDSWVTSIKGGFEGHDTKVAQSQYSRVTTIVDNTYPSPPSSSNTTIVYKVAPGVIPGIVDKYSGTNPNAFFTGGDLGYTNGILFWNNNSQAVIDATLAAAGVTDNNSVFAPNPNANTGGSYQQWTANFTIDERTTAYYIQAAFAFPVMGVPVSGVIGDRTIQTKTTATGFSRSTAVGGAVTFPAVAANGKYSNDLPSLNLKFEFIPNDLIGRFDIGKVMARPEPSNESLGLTLDGNFHTGSQGNPSLLPYLATNTDLGLEKYVNKDTYISAVYFTKAISRYITTTTIPTIIGSDPVPYNITTKVNGSDHVKIRGFEIGGQTAFTFLPAPFDGLGLIANVTSQKAYGYHQLNLIDGTPLDFPGVSKLAYNASLYYEDSLFSARLSYNWRDRRLDTAIGRNNSPEYTDAYGTIDASFDYNITPKLTLFMDGENLGNEPLIQENSPIRRINYETDGKRMFFGLRYKN